MSNDDSIFCFMYTVCVGFCFTVNVYFLFRAKMKGFPAWPAKVSVQINSRARGSACLAPVAASRLAGGFVFHCLFYRSGGCH